MFCAGSGRFRACGGKSAGVDTVMTLGAFLKMTGATAVYVLITAALWYFYSKKEEHGKKEKRLIGLIYGICSVLATHFGIIEGDMLVLNVRDMGPLAAGLFFSPASGLIAGTIGGVERIIAGQFWGIGSFTRFACGLSTFLAGVLAAIMNRAVYETRRPPVTQAFFLGAVTEVFHMYAILFTNRDSMNMAYYIVKEISAPMILFTAVGLAVCSMAVTRISKEPSDLGIRMQQEETPVTILFQRSLLVVTVGLFLFNFIVSYNLQTRLVSDDISNNLNYMSYEKFEIYKEHGSLEELKEDLAGQTDMTYFYFLVGNDGSLEVLPDGTGFSASSLKAEDLELIRTKVGDKTFIAELKTFPGAELMMKVVSLKTNLYLVVSREMITVYFDRDAHLYENTLSDILLFTVMYMLVSLLVDRLVVRNLHRVNQSLKKITDGDLNETVWVHTSAEFTALSEDINRTVSALSGYINAAEQKMKDELTLAAAIQESALPKNFRLPADNIEIYALMTPAKQVGGDFYDIFYIGHNLLCLAIADVSGKGVPASLFMMRAKTAIKNYARSGISPAEVLAHVNHTLCEGNDAEMFVTVWLGILDLRTGNMQCANAGHEYPVIMRAGGQYELMKDRHGLVLAAMDGIRFTDYEIQLNPGDRIFVYTDGVPEAINEKNEAYGTGRLTDRLNRVKNNSQEYILEDVLQDIRNFAGSAEQFDDITMLGFTYLRRPE